ncbi:MAG: PQQ-dependent sugar dehydrogenase [Acidobacteriota bacterium]
MIPSSVVRSAGRSRLVLLFVTLLSIALPATLSAADSAWTNAAGEVPRGALPDDLDLVDVAFLSGTVAIRDPGDGTDRLFLVQQPGIIRVFDLTTLTILPTPFLDIQSDVDDGGNEQGLLGLAFHPDYETNGEFFVNYTRDPGPGLDRTRIERYTVSGDPNVADESSATTILEIEQDFGNHNGGDIHFGPDGYLYIGMGDGGDGGDPEERSQDPMQLLGKMLRIDVDSSTTTGTLCGLARNYGIPADNPEVGDAMSCDEIWALGVRNPWRFSFDRVTGDLFIGDVGQGAREEVSFQAAGSPGGENYGWDCYEGNNEFELAGCVGAQNYVFPILEYDHGGGRCSITGGYRYRGPITGLVGVYVFADFCSRDIYFGTEDTPGTWSWTTWRPNVGNITTFGEDRFGNLYVASRGGTIWRFEAPGEIFSNGFESGDTTAWD